MNVVRLKVTLETLAEALCLPKTSKIKLVLHEGDDIAATLVTLVIEDTNLPSVSEGDVILLANEDAVLLSTVLPDPHWRVVYERDVPVDIKLSA
jgi:hypothetical protein